MLPERVYKIAGMEEWDAALSGGVYGGSPDDQADGFIHFSTLEQLRGTAAKHFAGRDDLLLITVETAPMARHYKMEASRGGKLFPHLYARLPVANAVEWEELPMAADGTHIFPDWVPAGENR